MYWSGILKKVLKLMLLEKDVMSEKVKILQNSKVPNNSKIGKDMKKYNFSKFSNLVQF